MTRKNQTTSTRPTPLQLTLAALLALTTSIAAAGEPVELPEPTGMIRVDCAKDWALFLVPGAELDDFEGVSIASRDLHAKR